MANKETFTAKVGNEDVELAVVRPTQKQLGEAQIEFNRALSKAIDSKAPIRAKLDRILREQGLWDEDLQKEFDDVRDKIYKCERTLETGNIKLSEAKAVALELRKYRNSLTRLLEVRNGMDYLTAEAQAENRKFDYLVSSCLVYNTTGKPYFQDLDSYLKSSGNEVASIGATKLAHMIYGLDPDYRKKLPENQFLMNYGFANADLQLVDKRGRLIDEDGRLIDTEGYFVNESGERVDIYGNQTTVEFKGFIDDETGEVVTIQAKVASKDTKSDQVDSPNPKSVVATKESPAKERTPVPAKT